MGLYDCTILNFIKRNGIVFRDRVAWKFQEKTISHGQFYDFSHRLAAGLIHAGIKKGDRIGVVGKNSLHYIYLFAAAAMVGAVVVPINWRLKPKEIQYILSDASPRFLFSESEFDVLIRSEIEDNESIERHYPLDNASNTSLIFEDLMSSSDGYSFEDLSSNDPYVIIYTAAVDGKPQGAVLTHQNMLLANFQLMYFWQLTDSDIHINLLPFYHIHGLAMCFSIMQAGGQNIIIPKFDAKVAAKHIYEDKVSIFAEFAPMLSGILDEAEKAAYDISSLRIVSGLDSPETIKRLEESTFAKVWISYGQTETTGGSASIGVYSDRPGSAGPCSPLMDVGIMDQRGEILENGKAGEIVVRGPMVFSGYWKQKVNKQIKSVLAWHHTGDIGRIDNDGYLWFGGRKREKNLIKTGGENVYPKEVEDVILAHPSIEEVVVFGVLDEQWGESIKAVCVRKKGTTISKKELINFVSDRIAGFKKPRYVAFVHSIPRDQEGIVDLDRVKNL